MGNARNFAFKVLAGIGAKAALSEASQRVAFNAIRLYRPDIRDLLESNEIKFLSYCAARRSWSNSQIMQDLWVCFELGEQQTGYFVEFGAADGMKHSNTLLLESRFGWSGVLAEPNPFWHSALSKNRTAAIETKCVSSASNQTVSFVTTDDVDPELSGIASFADNDHFADTRSKGKTITVETLSLDDLLRKYNAPKVIDYMSIDTEGSEFDILSAFSFDRDVRLISVETNQNTDPKIDRLLTSKGYTRVFKNFSQWDSWYVGASVRKPASAIVAPTS